MRKQILFFSIMYVTIYAGSPTDQPARLGLNLAGAGLSNSSPVPPFGRQSSIGSQGSARSDASSISYHVESGYESFGSDDNEFHRTPQSTQRTQPLTPQSTERAGDEQESNGALPTHRGPSRLGGYALPQIVSLLSAQQRTADNRVSLVLPLIEPNTQSPRRSSLSPRATNNS